MSLDPKDILRLTRSMKLLGVSNFKLDGLEVHFDQRATAHLAPKTPRSEARPAPTQLEQDEIDMFYSSTRTF